MERAGLAVVVAGLLVLATVAMSGGSSEVTDERETAYVSITFDDAYRSQYAAADVLEQRGWRGVFYVPVGQLDGTFEGVSTMTRKQVQELASRGHEIGGHTYNHTNLSALTDAEAAASLQRNRDALHDLGVTPVSFAYPHGQPSHVETVSSFYRYARDNGWSSNTVPPGTVVSSVSLTEENHGALDGYLSRLDAGGWLVISIHHVDTDGDVDRPAIDVSQDTYESILDRVAAANVSVVTMREMTDIVEET